MAINKFRHLSSTPLDLSGRINSESSSARPQSPVVFNESITVSANNSLNGGIIFSDDGDIVDPNTGVLAFRFSGGIQVYSANRGGSPVITLESGGNIVLANSGTTTRGLLGTAGDNDLWFFGGGATGSNAGFAQISTGDDGTEPIYVRQYSGDPRSGTLQRTTTLLDGSGNTLINNTTATGTASQPLQVTGGGYFSQAVGIGTTNPRSTLHVLGSGLITGISTIANLRITPVGTGATVGGIGVTYYGDGSGLTGIVTSITAGSGISINQSTGNVTINATSSGGGGGDDWSSTTAGIHTLSNVGIGTTNPTSTLTVQGNSLFTGILTARNAATQDSISLNGRAGGTSSFNLSLTPTTLTASRTVTFQNITGTVYVSTGTDVTLADGGTNASLTATNGGVVYSTATAMAITPAGTSGQVLTSAGAAAPSWTSSLNISGISAIANLRITPVGTGATVGSAGVGVVTYYGDGSQLSGVSAAGYQFNTGITTSIAAQLTAVGSNVLTLPSTAGRQYIIHSINASNIAVGNTDVNVIGAFDISGGERSYFAYNIPVPTGISVELLKQPMVLNPSDKIVMRATDYDRAGIETGVQVYISYQETTNMNYFGVGVGTVSIATTSPTTIYTSTGSGSVLQSIRLANRTDSGGYPVSVAINIGVVTTYLIDDLIIPKYGSVELLDNPKSIPTGSSIQVTLGQTSTIDVQVSGIKF